MKSDSRLVGRLGAVSAGAAIGVFGIGSLVLVGWTCDIAILKSLSSQGETQKKECGWESPTTRS
jgi:hypothetical protein